MDAPPGQSRGLGVAGGVTHGTAFPWCNSAADFDKHRIDVTVGARVFKVWQADPGSSERIRLSGDGAWHWPGDVIGGYAAAGVLEAATLGNDRVLVAHDA